MLISQDLRRVASVLNNVSDFPLPILNPVHSLFHHMNLNSILSGEKSLEEIEKTSYWSTDKPILIRYSLWEEDLQKEKRIHVVLENSIPKSLEDVVSNATEICAYSSLEELTALDKKFSSVALASSFNYLLKKIKNHAKKPLLLIEGFNNIVPINSMIHQSSTILIVAPGKIAVTNTDRFKKTQKFLMTEFLPVDKYLSHSVVKEEFSIPFDPNENDWYQIIANIKEII
jgi:predicted P-loop ATPase/GTPase